jgi:hypothetical protein
MQRAQRMTDDVKTHVKSKSTWTRLIYLILYGIIYRVAEIVLLAITIVQFLKSLLTGSPFTRLQSFGGALAEYNKQLVAFLSYQSDEKPFPVGPWPPEPEIEKADEVIIVAEKADETPPPKKSTTTKKTDDPKKDTGPETT